MPMTSRWGQQNPLVRRVQQHGALTTLFRATAAPANGRRLSPMPFVLGQMAPPLLPETAVAASPMAAVWAETDLAAAWTTADPGTPVVEETTQSVASVQPTTPVATSAPPTMDSPVFSAASWPVQRPALAAPGREAQPAVVAPPSLPSPLPVQRQMLPSTAAFPTGTPATIAASQPLSPPQGTAVATRATPLVAATLPVASSFGSTPAPALPALASTFAATVQPGSTTASGALLYQPAATPVTPAVQPGAAGQVTGVQDAAPASSPQPQPSAVQRQADPTTTSGDGIDDRTWSRLQSAFRKAKAQASESVSTPLPSPTAAAPVTRTPVVAAQRQAERGALRRTAMSEPRVGQPFPPAPSVVRSSVVAPSLPPVEVQPLVSGEATAPPMLQRSLTAVVGHQAAAITAGNLPPPAESTSISAGTPSVENSAAPPSVSGEEQLQSPSLIGELALSSAPSAVTAPAVVQRAAAPHPAAGATVVAPTEWPAPTQPDTAPAQSLALEAVWPVQRLSAPTAFAPTATTDEWVQPDFPASTAAEPSPVMTETVRRQLEATQTARPTDSKVDILAPRRPRPVLRSATAPVETVAGSAPVQRQSEEASLAVSSSPVRQTEAVQPALVPTEIGPLPADLWRLIGAQPPVPPPLVTATGPTATQPPVTAVATPTTGATQPSSIQMALVANAPVTVQPIQPALAVSVEPTRDEPSPAPDSLTDWRTPVTAPAEAPSANMATWTIPASFAAASAVATPLATETATDLVAASGARLSAPILPAVQPDPATTAAVQMKASAITVMQPATVNEKRNAPPPLLVTQQAPPTVLRQSAPPVAEPATNETAPATSGKKKRRKRSTPTK